MASRPRSKSRASLRWPTTWRWRWRQTIRIEAPVPPQRRGHRSAERGNGLVALRDVMESTIGQVKKASWRLRWQDVSGQPVSPTWLRCRTCSSLDDRLRQVGCVNAIITCFWRAIRRTICAC
jgi:hypothetical protein